MEEKSKILIVNFSSAFGGGENSIIQLAGLLKSTYDIFFVYQNRSFEEYANEYKLFRINIGKFLTPLLPIKFVIAVVKLFSIIVTVKPDVVIANTKRAHFFMWIVNKVVKTKTINIFRDFQTSFFWHKKFSKSAVLNIYVSKMLSSHYNANEKSKTLYNIIGEVGNKSIKRIEDRDYIKVGAIGRFVRWKGYDVILKSISSLKKAKYPVNLEICGSLSNSKEEQEYLDTLKQMTIELDIVENVKFTSWINNVDQFICNCDFIISSSISSFGGPESFGRVILETWRNKRPIIASNCGGPKELITDRVDGLLFKEGDEEDLFDKLNSLMDDKELCKVIADGGYKTYSSKFNPQVIANQYKEVFESIIYE